MQCFDNRFPGRGGVNDAIEFFGRGSLCVAGPAGTELPGKISFILAPGKNIYPGIGKFVCDHFQHEMGRCTKADEAKALAGFDLAEAESPIADDTGAKEWSGFLVGKNGGDGIGKFLGNGDVFCVTSVDMVSGEASVVTEVFFPLLCIYTIILC